MESTIILICLFVATILASSVVASSVVLNEILAKPVTDNEWVELYNPTDQTISLQGWMIKDGNSVSTDDLNLTGEIRPGQFRVFENSKSWLNDSGDSVSLVNGTETIDNFEYQTATSDKSFARIPDGQSWSQTTRLTKNSSNLSDQTQVILAENPSPSATVTETKVPSAFQISTNTSTLTSDQTLQVSVTLISSSANSQYFLKGAYYKDGSINYFGQTKVSGNWIDNNQSFDHQLPIQTDSNGNWSGTLEVKVNPQDSGFTGSGSYLFKVAKYTSAGSGPSWSNQLSLSLSQSNPATQISSTPSPTLSPKPAVLGQASQSAFTTPTRFPDSVTVQPTRSPTSPVEVKSDKQSNSYLFLVFGGLVLLVGVGMLVYTLKNR